MRRRARRNREAKGKAGVKEGREKKGKWQGTIETLTMNLDVGTLASNRCNRRFRKFSLSGFLPRFWNSSLPAAFFHFSKPKLMLYEFFRILHFITQILHMALPELLVQFSTAFQIPHLK